MSGAGGGYGGVGGYGGAGSPGAGSQPNHPSAGSGGGPTGSGYGGGGAPYAPRRPGDAYFSPYGYSPPSSYPSGPGLASAGGGGASSSSYGHQHGSRSNVPVGGSSGANHGAGGGGGGGGPPLAHAPSTGPSSNPSSGPFDNSPLTAHTVPTPGNGVGVEGRRNNNEGAEAGDEEEDEDVKDNVMEDVVSGLEDEAGDEDAVQPPGEGLRSTGSGSGRRSPGGTLINTGLTTQTLNIDGTPKRPMNAFMLFARVRRPQVSAENPHMKTGEVSKVLSKEWGTMTREQKKYYITQGKLLKEEFNAKYPNYVYRRRPNNSRRKKKSSPNAANSAPGADNVGGVGGGLSHGHQSSGSGSDTRSPLIMPHIPSASTSGAGMNIKSEFGLSSNSPFYNGSGYPSTHGSSSAGYGGGANSGLDMRDHGYPPSGMGGGPPAYSPYLNSSSSHGGGGGGGTGAPFHYFSQFGYPPGGSGPLSGSGASGLGSGVMSVMPGAAISSHARSLPPLQVPPMTSRQPNTMAPQPQLPSISAPWPARAPTHTPTPGPHTPTTTGGASPTSNGAPGGARAWSTHSSGLNTLPPVLLPYMHGHSASGPPAGMTTRSSSSGSYVGGAETSGRGYSSSSMNPYGPRASPPSSHLTASPEIPFNHPSTHSNSSSASYPGQGGYGYPSGNSGSNHSPPSGSAYPWDYGNGVGR